MKGKQKTVFDGLKHLAGKVAEGVYGRDDAAFSSEPPDGHPDAYSERDEFCEDYEEYVINKID